MIILDSGILSLSHPNISIFINLFKSYKVYNAVFQSYFLPSKINTHCITNSTTSGGDG